MCEGVCFHWNGILGDDVTRFYALLGERTFKIRAMVMALLTTHLKYLIADL